MRLVGLVLLLQQLRSHPTPTDARGRFAPDGERWAATYPCSCDILFTFWKRIRAGGAVSVTADEI